MDHFCSFGLSWDSQAGTLHTCSPELLLEEISQRNVNALFEVKKKDN